MAATNKAVPKGVCKEEDREAMVEILNRIGDKWTIMIVGELIDGPMRYSDLQRRIGVISQRMLTLSLKGLLDDGLVSRTVYPTIPPRVDYELTDLGLGLRASLRPLWEWAGANMQKVIASRQKGTKRKATLTAALTRGLREGAGSGEGTARAKSLRNRSSSVRQTS